MNGKSIAQTLKEEPRLPFWWSALLLPLPMIGTSLILGGFYFRSAEPPGRDTSLIAYSFACLLAAGFLLFLVHRKTPRPFSVLGFSGPVKIRHLAYGVLAFIAAGILYEVCHDLLERIGIPMYHNDERETPVDPAGLLSTILLVVSVCIFVPFSEELIYRGYLLKSLTQKGGLRAGCLGSTLIFAVIHFPFFGPGMAIYIIPWSLIAIGLYLFTGSLYSSILFHVLNNAFAYLLAPLLYEK